MVLNILDNHQLILLALRLQELACAADVLDKNWRERLGVLVDDAVRAAERAVLGNQLQHFDQLQPDEVAVGLFVLLLFADQGFADGVVHNLRSRGLIDADNSEVFIIHVQLNTS